MNLNINLKYTEIKYYAVDYDDLDNFINQLFEWPTDGSGFEFVSKHCANNGSNYDFDITGVIDTKYTWDMGQLDHLEKAILLKQYDTGIGIPLILNWLAKMGHIPKGKYLVEVNW